MRAILRESCEEHGVAYKFYVFVLYHTIWLDCCSAAQPRVVD